MEPSTAPTFVNFVPIIVIVGIFYFLFIRPQQKQAKEHKKMLDALTKGDKVLTTGGIIGTITGVKDQELELKIAESVKVTIVRSGVSSKIS